MSRWTNKQLAVLDEVKGQLHDLDKRSTKVIADLRAAIGTLTDERTALEAVNARLRSRLAAAEGGDSVGVTCACRWQALPKGGGANGPQLVECAEHAAIREKLDQAKRLLDTVAPHICGQCGPHARVDEDQCCAVCGGTTYLAGETYGRETGSTDAADGRGRGKV